MKVTGH